ncbi:hypothetical protein BH10PSE19_BH10PSE19_00140 [soil metagenome]
MKRNTFITLYLITTVLCSVLSGCASLNSKFDCPMKPGIRCESIHNVNAMVDNGQLGAKSPCLTCQAAAHVSYITPVPSSIPMINSGMPLQRVRVWMASYEDKEGNYYQPAVLYKIVRPSANKISDDEE